MIGVGSTPPHYAVPLSTHVPFVFFSVWLEPYLNYGFWFSGPVTALAARRVWYGGGHALPSLPRADPLAGYHLRGRNAEFYLACLGAPY